MIKEIKYGGYTTTPSDYECPDGELATVVNLCPDDEGGALRAVLPPSGLFALPLPKEVLLIHHTAAYKHYIVIDRTDMSLWWLDDAEDIAPLDKPIGASEVALLLRGPLHTFGATDAVRQVVPVGNTLVCLTDSGVHYILWTSDEAYSYLGTKVPELQITWGLDTQLTCYPKDKKQGGSTVPSKTASLKFNIWSTDFYAVFISNHGEDAWAEPKDVWSPPQSFEEAFDYSIEGENESAKYIAKMTDFALGKIQRLVREEGTDKGRFVYPFFVRWAYELYDGSLTMHSDPVLLVPNSKYPFFGMDGWHGIKLEDVDNDNRWYEFWGRAYGFVSQLTAKIAGGTSVLTELRSKWKDIVKGVAVYVSAPVYTYDQDGKVYGWTNMDDSGAWDEYFTEGNMTVGSTTLAKHWQLEDVFDAWNESTATGTGREEHYFQKYDSAHTMPSYIFTMPEKTKEEITKSLDTGQFYLLKTIDITSDELYQMTGYNRAIDIEKGVLESLVTRQAMPDDYHSRDHITAASAFAFNGRVNLGGIERRLHNPLSPVAAWSRDDSGGKNWQLTVEMRQPGAVNVTKSALGAVGCDFPRYVFFADKNARTMYLECTSGGVTRKWKLSLQEHPFLEGAYWSAGLAATIDMSQTSDTVPGAVSEVIDEREKVMTSETNNPFYFPLLGINSVGTGEVLAVCAANKALSQGQFGEHPLYAFTTEGVWALATTSSGGYSAVQPFVRDVCRNVDSITQLDDAVLFASDRGVMCISGSQVVCLSDNLESDKQFAVADLPNGDSLISLAGIDASALTIMPWREFLAGCKMIYDYTGQRVVVYHPSVRYAYIYSLKTHKWGMMHSLLTSGVNSYPQALAMDNEGTLVDVSNGDEGLTGIKGMIITRPFKLDPIDALKTIDTIIQRGYFDHADQTRAVKPVRQILWGSRDLFHWQTIWSSQDHYLRGEWGTPYKYFRLGLLCDLRQEESLTGCTVQYQVRGTNQPR